MSTRSANTGSVMLRGPKVQYASGKTVTPKPFALDDVLAGYLRLPDDKRRAFLSIFSHSLTVDMRVALLDRPVSDANAERAWRINEWLHHLTSCFNPTSSWGAEGEAELIRNITAEALRHGLDGAVGRAIATAAGNTMIAAAKRKFAAATAS